MKKVILDYDEITGNIMHNSMIIATYMGLPTVNDTIGESTVDSAILKELINNGITIFDIIELKNKGVI